MNETQAAAAIAKLDPDLEVERIAPAREGELFSDFLVNGHRIYRLARNDEAVRTLAVENAVLPLIGGMVDLAVPCFSLVTERGVTYERIHGEPLTRARFEAMDADSRERCVQMLGEFTEQLRATDTERAAKLGVTRCAYPFARTEAGLRRGNPAALYAEDLAALRGHGLLDDDQLARCARVKEALIAQAEAVKLGLVHGALVPDHILYDAASSWICGVVEFSGILLTDPLFDLAGLFDSYGEALLEGRSADEVATVRRLSCWRSVLGLVEAAASDQAEALTHWRSQLDANDIDR